MPTPKTPVQTGSLDLPPPSSPLELEPELPSNGPYLTDPKSPDESVRLAMIKLQAEHAVAELRERYQREVTPNPMLFATLLAEAQANFKPVVRNRTVRVWSKRTQSEYTFTYAELPTVLAACLPALNERGFYFRQFIDPADRHVLISELLHAHGTLACRTPLFVMDADGQGYNSAITYARRTGANLMFGVAGEEDDDGNRADGNEINGSAGAGAGKGRAQPKATPAKVAPKHTPAPAPDPVKVDLEATPQAPADEREFEKAEGRIVDATAELQEAASEGRAHGIIQIWDEIRSETYVATMVWQRLKRETPDSFKVIQSTIEASDKARGVSRAPVKRGDRG